MIKSLFTIYSDMSGANTINYSNLNIALQPKRGFTGDIIKKVAKEIGDVFLVKNTYVKKDSMKTSKLNGLAEMVKNSSEAAKTRFVITVNTLMEKGLLKTDQIKKFNLTGTDGNKNLGNIMDELLSHLTDSERETVNKSINEAFDKHYEEIASKNDNMDGLRSENEALKAELAASEIANGFLDEKVGSRWSINKYFRKLYAIKETYKNPKLDDETKARKMLWLAKKHVLWGMAGRPRVFSGLKNMNMNDTYNEIVDQLKAEIPSASDESKIAMRGIMKRVNTAYELYIKSIDIPKNVRSDNMRYVNMAMAA